MYDTRVLWVVINFKLKKMQKQPYEMSREEWQFEYNQCRADGMPRHNGANKSARNDSLRKLERMQFLLFGIGKWIYDLACKGEDFALEAFESQIYDNYDMVIKKATMEGIL